ncbi:hypothetical protein WDU94_011020 [Cyamophila willieti]
MGFSLNRMFFVAFLISFAIGTMNGEGEEEESTEIPLHEEFSVPYYPFREPKMKEHHIVPHVVSDMPKQIFWAMYKKKGAKQQNVLLGRRINPHEAQVVPEVHWDAGWNQSIYFTMMMVNPDHHGKDNPMHDQYCHWLVGNIPGDNMTVAHTIVPYEPPAPARGTGFQRYLFLVYYQPQGKIDFAESHQKPFSREHFSATKFAQKYNFSGIESGNFFRSRFYDWSKHKNVTEGSDKMSRTDGCL